MTYAILYDITPNHADARILSGTDEDYLDDIADMSDDAKVAIVPDDTHDGDRVRLAECKIITDPLAHFA